MPTKDIVTWILGVLVIIIVSLVGYNQQLQNKRLERIEHDIDIIQAQYSQITELRVQMTYIQRDVTKLLDGMEIRR